MKQFNFKLEKGALQLFFPHNRVKTKNEILKIILESTRFMMYSTKTESIHNEGFTFYSDKMSRLFFYRTNKFYSITFPFFITEYENEFKFFTKTGIELNSNIVSNLIEALNQNLYKDVIDYADYIDNLSKEASPHLWELIMELMLFEEGYLRFDIDFDGYEEAKGKGNEHLHPLNHLDFFYSNSGSFKIGLDTKETLESFIDVLNLKTSCRYLIKR